jgi:hypothetical protein
MNRIWLSAIALFALTAKAQNINFPDIPHIHTALNHLTVIDLGEPIQFIAAADPQSFQIERAGDKVLLQPLKDSATTNLILWTASRQVSYELDAPGDVAQMNVLVRNIPALVHAAANAPTAKERDEIAVAATGKALVDAQNVIADKSSHASSGIEASIVRVLHTSQGTYLQYQVVNHSTTPIRVTAPSVTRLSPSQIPVSLPALRGHQLSAQTLNEFKAKPDGSSPAILGQSEQADVRPGASTTGYVLIRTSSGDVPEIYQFSFGSSESGPLVETVVI